MAPLVAPVLLQEPTLFEQGGLTDVLPALRDLVLVGLSDIWARGPASRSLQESHKVILGVPRIGSRLSA